MDHEIEQLSSWFNAVVNHENIPSSYIWHINKENNYKNYDKRIVVYEGPDGREELKINQIPNCKHIKRLYEAVFFPNGKYVVPIRQFCELKIMPLGVKDVSFYNFENITMNGINELDEAISSPAIRSTVVSPSPRGTKITIGYLQIKNQPIDLVYKINQSFVLESIADENKLIMESCNGIIPEGNWIDGNGHFIDNDIGYLPKLTLKSLRVAREIIIKNGLNTNELVLYTTPSGMSQLMNDPEANKVSDIGSLLGIKIIIDSSVKKTGIVQTYRKETIFQKIWRFFTRKHREVVTVGGTGDRSILFVAGTTFGLVSGENITMEAQRRNEFQSINVTGIHRLAGIITNTKSIVRISHRRE